MSAEEIGTEARSATSDGARRRKDSRATEDNSSVPKKDIEHESAIPTGNKGAKNNMRRSSNEGRLGSSSGGSNNSIGDTSRKSGSPGGAVKRPTMEGIFNNSDEDSDGIFGTVGSGDSADRSASSTPRNSNRNRRRPSSRSPETGHASRRRGSRSDGSHSSPKRRKSHSRERRRSSRGHDEELSPRRSRRQGGRGSSGPSSLSQTQHAAQSLVAMGMGKSRSRLPRTRAGVKEQGRAREWASFCRRRTYLSLEDLPREERPRVARKGAITPFSLQLMKVEGWQVPPVLIERASASGHGLRFSLSVSFYHAGSKRFYGDTFMGELLDEEDGERVEIVSERNRGKSSTQTKSSGGQKRGGRSRPKAGRDKKGRGRRQGRGKGKEEEDEEEEMEVGTKHEELVYWYTSFEDPNCIAVVELVATIMDNTNGIQVGQYGCGWTFIQFFGPNEPEAVQHRDVYRGSPRNLLFFEAGDWGSVGETAIPGCSLWFTLNVWENLMRARHLFRPDEIVSATDVLPGMQTKKISFPDQPAKIGHFIGLQIEEVAPSRPSSRSRNPDGGGPSKGGGRWSVAPARPRLAACMELRLSALRVIIPGREGYERDLLKSVGEDIPDQEIVKTVTQQHALGFSRTQREVVTSSAGADSSGGRGRGRVGQRAKIVDRRAKIGFHNGHTLVLPHEWAETHLEETDEEDVLMLPEEMSSLSVDGYVAHPLFALVVLIEYTIRTRPKHGAGRGETRGAGGRGKKGDALSQAEAELSHAALPVVVGMQVFVPYDGKRLRLRNTAPDGGSMDVGLRLAADKHVRLVTTELVYTNKQHLLDEAHGGASDDEDGRGPKMVYFDLKAYDSHGKALKDETPASGDESPLEASGWEPAKEPATESSDGDTSSTMDSTSSASSSESSSSEEEEDDSRAKPATPLKRKKPKQSRVEKPKPKTKRTRPPPQLSSSDGSTSESTTPSLVRGDSGTSFLRRPKAAKKRNAHVQATEDDWEEWRKGVKVPRRSESLMGRTLQAPLHVEASAQTTVVPDREPELDLYRPQAVIVGGFAPLAHDISRAGRTRLSRHGFTDVMKDTVESSAHTIGGVHHGQQHQTTIDFDLEVTDPLAKHEITLQFAAFRAPPAAGPGDDGRGGRVGAKVATPTSLYFTYQFYTCLPTRTERMLLRPDGPKDRLYQAEGFHGESQLSILVREGRYGRDEPSLGLRHSIDTATMQPFEAQAFASYMARSTLFVDVWDADALMHVGTLAVQLRALMRQQKGVVKTAMEYEVVASTGATEDCGSGGGVAVKHGMVGKGPVVGLVQILASNYGEPGKGGDLPASGAAPATVHPPQSGPNMRGDWRMASGPDGGVPALGQRRTRPRYKVRARPLSETNPELSKYMEAVTGPGAATGVAIASLGRRGRGDVDADSMGYDELMLLVRRFRGSVKGTVWYVGPLLRLLDVPGRKRLEQRLVRAVERSERSGLGLAEAFRGMDQHETGEISTHDLEEMFWGMLSPGEFAREHLKTVVSSIDPGGTGKVGLRELVTFVRARQGGGAGNARKNAETALRRAFARAELGGNSVEEAFFDRDHRGRDSLSHAEFWEAVRTLGGVPGLVKADLDPLLRRLDTDGDGRVSLPDLMEWGERSFLSAAGVENSVRKKILSWEAAALRDGQKVSIEGAFSATRDIASALKALGHVTLTSRELAALRRRFETDGGEAIDVPAVLRFFGRDVLCTTSAVATSAAPSAVATNEEQKEAEQQQRNDLEQAEAEREHSAVDVERKLRKIFLKAESMGTSLAEAFGVFDKDGSGFVTAAELEEGLRGLGVFDAIPKEQVLSLVRKLKRVRAGSTDDGGDLLVSAEEFVSFVGGEYEAAEAAQGRLRRVLKLAGEKEGISLEGAFGALDKNGTGSISTAGLEEGLRQLGVLDGMSREQAGLATRRFDCNGDGTVSLPEFLAFAGRPYTANDRPLEAKLRRVLLKAESMGTSMEEAFKHFDKDGCGSITSEGFSTGLREMGVFQEFSDEEVEQVVSSFGAHGEDGVSLPKFLRFLGKEYRRDGGGGEGGQSGGGRGLGGRLRLILKKADELGTPLSASFEGFGADERGRLSTQRLHGALKDIGQFRWTTVGEVKSFIRLLQDDDDGDDEHVTAAQSTIANRELFLTLPALKAFVAGGDAFLAENERAALARQQSLEVAPRPIEHSQRRAAAEITVRLSEGDETPHFGRKITRADSWSGKEGQDIEGPGATLKFGKGDKQEEALLERLRVVLLRVQPASQTGESGGGGVRGYLESFDVNSDGVLSSVELVAVLRSLGAKGGDFDGQRGLSALVSSRFRDGSRNAAASVDQEGASIVKIVWWFDDQRTRTVASKQGEGDTCSSRRKCSGGGAEDQQVREGARKTLEEQGRRAREFVPGEALRRAVRLAEAKGTTLERTFARLDEDGDGFITLRQLLRGLDQLGVFEQATRDDVLDALDTLDADRNSSRPKGRREEETKDGGRDGGTGGVDLVAFIRLMRQRPANTAGEAKECDDAASDRGSGKGDEEAPYEFSLDPDTKAAEKKLRRAVAKQARKGVDVEGVFRRYDPEQSGSVLRSDFVQAVMQLGVGLLDSSASRHTPSLANCTGEVDPIRRRQLGQLARTKGPVERRLMRMRQTRRRLFERDGEREETKGQEDTHGANFEDGDESLALIQWYREGQKKSMVRHILATSLTTEYNLFFAFASPLFLEHPFRNPFNHEERFRIDLDDHQLRVVTSAAEWAYLRRTVSPCVGEIGDSPLESDFFDVDPGRGVHVTLMAHEVVFIPFTFLSLEPRRPAPPPPPPSSPSKRTGSKGGGDRVDESRAFERAGAVTAERSVVVAFVSASHGHVISIMQVHLQRRAFAVNRTFRFFQNEGEILKRSIQLLPGGESPQRPIKPSSRSRHGLVEARQNRLMGGDEGAKYIHCVEEACQEGAGGGGGNDSAAGGVVIEWARRPAVGSGGHLCAGGDVQEVLVKCRVGRFPSRKSFYLLVYDDHHQGSLYETWHVIVQARLRMDVHSLLGQQSPADLVVRGDRYSRKVRAFSSAPAEMTFEPSNAFQLVPGAYNRVEVRFRPLSTGSRKVHVHLVDVDSMEIVGAWLATATAMPPVVTKSYDVDLPLGRACHKRIAYSNPWSSSRLFRLASSDPALLCPRYESLEVAGGGTGYLRLWFAAPEGASSRKEAFLFVNDSEGQNEECLLIRTRGV